MAVLSGQLIISTGLSVTVILRAQSFLVLAVSSFTDCRLVSYVLIIASVSFPLSSHLMAIALANSKQGIFQDYLSNFARFFGINAKQDVNNLHINKADLNLASTTNTAESLLIAILLQISNKESNLLISDVYIYLFSQQFENSLQPLLVFNLVVNLYKKIDYSTSLTKSLDGLMTNYSLIVVPDDFNH